MALLRLCEEGEDNAEKRAARAREHGTFRQAAYEYQVKEQFQSLKQQLLRASVATAELRTAIETLSIAARGAPGDDAQA